MPLEPSPTHDALSPDARRELILRQYAYTFADPLVQRWFDSSGFANFGYWDGAGSATDASNALVDRLIGMSDDRRRHSRVLDVGCGGGGTTRRLATHFDAAGIVGINIDPHQLQRARRAVPEATFLEMDAVDLRFDGGSFDLIICVEAAHHFETRGRFLTEAFRVLKPGGWLLLSDVLFATGRGILKDLRHALLRQLPNRPPRDFVPANMVANLEAYNELFRLAGFELMTVENPIERTWGEFYQRQRRFLIHAALANPRVIGTVLDRLRLFALWNTVIYAYPLVAARKPFVR